MIWIDVLVRIAAGCAALAAFYVAWFTYEDEDRKLQNRIATWWLQFDDVRSHMVSRQAAFVVVVARQAIDILDRMFGPRHLAKDSVAAAASLTLGSYFFSIVVSHAIKFGLDAASPARAAVPLTLFAIAAAPLVSPRLRLFPRAVMWVLAAALVAVILISLFFFVGGLLNGEPIEGFASFRGVEAQNLVVVGGLPVGVALTLFQVAVARRAMRSAIVARSEWPIVLGMALVAVPVGIMLGLGAMAVSAMDSLEAITLSSILFLVLIVTGATCVVTTALFALVAAVAGVMLLHRIAWPLASRILYALERYRLVQNKLALNAAGATLAGIAITGAYGWRAIVKHLGIA